MRRILTDRPYAHCKQRFYFFKNINWFVSFKFGYWLFCETISQFSDQSNEILKICKGRESCGNAYKKKAIKEEMVFRYTHQLWVVDMLTLFHCCSCNFMSGYGNEITIKITWIHQLLTKNHLHFLYNFLTVIWFLKVILFHCIHLWTSLCYY